MCDFQPQWSRWGELDLRKEILEYYVIYDLKDNIIAYIDSLDELSLFTHLKKKYLKFHFKNREYLYYIYDNSYRKIYRFF